MIFYNATRRVLPRHYAARMFALCFSAVHIPLLTFLTAQAVLGNWSWTLFFALLAATVVGSVLAIVGLAGMLRPVEVATQAMRALRDGRPTARIPVGGPDMAGELLETVAHAVRANAARFEALEDLAETDMLTGLFNRRGFLAELDRMGNPPGVVAMFDADGFKAVNDRLGHAEGDHVLRQMGDRLARHFGKVAVLGRWGGDEFLVFFPDHRIEQVSARIAKISRSLVTAPLGGPGDRPITFATGCAYCESGDDASLEQAIAAADADMFTAKERARR